MDSNPHTPDGAYMKATYNVPTQLGELNPTQHTVYIYNIHMSVCFALLFV